LRLQILKKSRTASLGLFGSYKKKLQTSRPRGTHVNRSAMEAVQKVFRVMLKVLSVRCLLNTTK